jgi:hypothetical protein
VVRPHGAKGKQRLPFAGALGEEDCRLPKPNSVFSRRERSMGHFTGDTLQRIMLNPLYAITVASPLTAQHEPAMSEEEWVRENALLM